MAGLLVAGRIGPRGYCRSGGVDAAQGFEVVELHRDRRAFDVVAQPRPGQRRGLVQRAHHVAEGRGRAGRQQADLDAQALGAAGVRPKDKLMVVVMKGATRFSKGRK